MKTFFLTVLLSAYLDFGPFFGKAFSAGSPRRTQFGLRYDF